MERRSFLGCMGGVAAVAGTAGAQQPAPPAAAAPLCRITVLKRSLQQEFADRYRSDPVKPCERFKDGQEFALSQPWNPPEGFCQWAWADIRAYVSANFHGWDFPTVACCTDGFRPVFFRIERIERERKA